MGPVLVRALLLPLAIQPRQRRPRRRLDTRGLGQLRQELLITLARVAADNAAQRGIRFQGSGVDPNGLALHQADGRQALQHPREHLPMGFLIDQPAGPGDRRVIRRRVVQRQAEEVPQRQRIGRPPRDTAFRVQALEAADEQQPKVDARRHARPSHRVRVEPRAGGLCEVVKSLVRQQSIQARVERMTHRRGQVGRRHPHRWLPIAIAFPIAMRRIVVQCAPPTTLTFMTIRHP